MGIDQSKVTTFQVKRPYVDQDIEFYEALVKHLIWAQTTFHRFYAHRQFIDYFYANLLRIMGYCVCNNLYIEVRSKSYPQINGRYKFDAHNSKYCYIHCWNAIVLCEVQDYSKKIHFTEHEVLFETPEPKLFHTSINHFGKQFAHLKDFLEFRCPQQDTRKFGKEVSVYDPVFGPDIVCDYLGDVIW